VKHQLKEKVRNSNKNRFNDSHDVGELHEFEATSYSLTIEFVPLLQHLTRSNTTNQKKNFPKLNAQADINLVLLPE
jgi:hypothetical protein